MGDWVGAWQTLWVANVADDHDDEDDDDDNDDGNGICFPFTKTV